MTTEHRLPAGAQGPPTATEWVAAFDAGAADGGTPSVTGGGDPSIARDGSGWLLFAGWLFERERLARLLGAEPGSRSGDAALLLRAWNRWGSETLGRVRGTFALLVWDRRRARLTAARDPLGIHPLFWAATGERLLFSSSMAALLRSPGVSGELHRAALAERLLFRWPSAEETIFTAVRRVLPGHRLTVSRGVVRRARYWDPLPDDRPLEWVEEEAEALFERRLERAVDRCLEPGPSAVYLSGGLDSISVAAVAADRARRHGRPAPQALSLAFPDPDCNEVDVQRHAARTLGLPIRLVGLDDAVGGEGLLRGALAACARYAAPSCDVCAPAFERLDAEARRRGLTVALTGGGGDEWLGVTPRLAADLLRAGDLRGLVHLAASLRRGFRVGLLPAARTVIWDCGLRSLGVEAARALAPRPAAAIHGALRRRRLPDWLAPDPALRRELEERAAGAPPPSGQASHYLRGVRWGLDHPVNSLEFEQHHERTARRGLRLLRPYWDPDLVALLCRVPPRRLNQGRRAKGLVRELLARRWRGLGVETQRKVVLGTFLARRVASQAPGCWRELGGARALTELGLVRPDLVEPAVGRMVAAGTPTTSYALWELLNLESWLRPRLGLSSPFAARSRAA